MNPRDFTSMRGVEPLAGRAHAVGALELRRLVLEGATVVTAASALQRQILQGEAVLLSSADSDADLAERLPENDALLVCLGENCGSAGALAERLCRAGYQYVFMAEGQSLDLDLGHATGG